MSTYKKSGFSRALSLTKTSFNLGKIALQQFKDDQRPTPEKIIQQVQLMAKEMGVLKGSLMKAGQLLSSYGETFLPKEAVEILKTLQQKSGSLSWSELEPIVKKELKENFDKLEIEPTAIAAASIGQVHRAKIKATGEIIALKIQYPNLENAIDMDLKFLKLILNSLKMIPQMPNYSEVYSEIKDMMLQELNYKNELKYAKKFKEILADDPRFLVPKSYDEFCTDKILAFEFIDGERFDSHKIQSLSQEFRNRIGEAFFDLYLKELLEFKMMQTDPHGGNYRVQLMDNNQFRIVLFDFGAVREIPDDFLKSYQKIMAGSLFNQDEKVIDGGISLGVLQKTDPPALKQDYVIICQMLVEPFQKNINHPNSSDLNSSESSDSKYDFAASDLPKRVIQVTRDLVIKHGLRAPPREVIFLDRKLAGVYTTLKDLKVHSQFRHLIESKLGKQL